MPRSTEIVGEKTNSTGLIIHRIIAYVVLVLLVVVSLFPFYLLIINATRGRSQAGIRWYRLPLPRNKLQEPFQRFNSRSIRKRMAFTG